MAQIKGDRFSDSPSNAGREDAERLTEGGSSLSAADISAPSPPGANPLSLSGSLTAQQKPNKKNYSENLPSAHVEVSNASGYFSAVDSTGGGLETNAKLLHTQHTHLQPLQ